MEIAELVKAQRTYFETDATKDVAFRVAALTRLRQEILRREICFRRPAPLLEYIHH